MANPYRKVICALDLHDLDEALKVTRRLAPYVGAFKVGHGLVLPYGLDVLDRLRDAGATRIFLDLKFHDIPNSVAIAVAEAARRGVWMMTLHISGGSAMLQAAVIEARAYAEHERPLLVGVSVLTSLDQRMLNEQLGVPRSLEEHMVSLSRLAIDHELDGVVCSAHEIKAIRHALGGQGVVVTPGIRLPNSDSHDQRRVGEARQALEDGADYLVIGRALISSVDPQHALERLGVVSAP
jgi:orotidine-5'-phosphate decarboxylase